jgi:hypothetical protein
MMDMLARIKNIEWALWLSRIVRWGFGGSVICLGIHFNYEWPVIIFGVLLFITGFFRPVRCMDGRCDETLFNPPDKKEP